MVNNIKEVLIKNGGLTINRQGEATQLKSGYQVSIFDGEVVELDKFNDAMVNRYFKMLNRGEYLGLWLDDNKVYIDISRRIATKRDALKIGRALNQLSILNWRTMGCVAVA